MRITLSAALGVESLVIVGLIGWCVTEQRGHAVPPLATATAQRPAISGTQPAPTGPFAPRTIATNANYTAMLPIDLENPARALVPGQVFDACGVDATKAAKCVKDLILVELRCTVRNPGECEAGVALPQDSEGELEAIIVGGQRAHVFTPRKR